MIARDFLDLTHQQQSVYVDGIIDAIAYTQKTDRAHVWYYRGPGPKQLADTLKKYPALPVVGIIQTLLNRSCV